MATWIWIVIAAGAIVALAVVVFGMRGRRVARRREKAQELRQDAEQRHRKAKEHESLAEELADRAKSEREEADKVGARAAKVDPDRD
jgi:flagellar biosynthesis/type III secretory pathway M-ring protein FliF/YscJ